MVGECAFVAPLSVREKDAALCERVNNAPPDRLSSVASRIGRDGRRPPSTSNAPVSAPAARRSTPATRTISASTSSLCERRWWNGTGGLPELGAVGDSRLGTVGVCVSVAPRPAPFPVERDRDKDPEPFPIELSAPELPASPPSASSARAFSPAASASAARSADEDVAECSRDEALGLCARAGDAGPTRSTRPESSVLSESEDPPPPFRVETPERP